MAAPIEHQTPVVSFCISTFRRPDFLKNQLHSLLSQTFPELNVVVSDNDPERSAEAVVKAVNDPRVHYYCNGENLGMIKSFNKSISRSATEYIVMITDDDPLSIHFLEEIFTIICNNPGYPIYAGVSRKGKVAGAIEKFDENHFAAELINPTLTQKCLWSNCIIKRETVLSIGCIPDYDSPHLADHAFLALCGSVKGGVMVNTNFGDHNSHEQAYSMSNIDSYYRGCKGFYETLSERFGGTPAEERLNIALKANLYEWFIVRSFFLRRTFYKKDKSKVEELNRTDKKILALPFMHGIHTKYWFKRAMFLIKSVLLSF